MVNALKKNFSPLLGGKYSKLTSRSTQEHHQANEGKSGLDAEKIQALGAFCSLQSNKKLGADTGRETHFLSNEEKENWIEDYVERETGGARKQVEDAEAAIRQEQEDAEAAENAGLTSTEPKKTSHGMMVAIGDSLSDIASSDNGEDREGEDDEETELRQLSKDDEPGGVMGTMTKKVQQRMERFRQKQMKLDQLTQLGCEDAADYFCDRDKKYSTSELKVPAVVQLQPEDDAASPALTTCEELMKCLDTVPGISQLPQGTTHTESSHMRPESGKPQLNMSIHGLAPSAEPDSSPFLTSKLVTPLNFHPCL